MGCIVGYLRGLRIQAIDRRLLICSCRLQLANSGLICIRLIHGSLDISQCGGHARAILDLPLHRQRLCFDTVHAVQRLAIIRESCCLLLQGGDVGFIRGDTVSSGHQSTLICFISKRVIQSNPLSLQFIYVFHQSDGSITNRAFKSCYFPLYAPYASLQSCNRILIRLLCQFRIDISLIRFIVFQIGDVSFIRSDVLCILNNLGLIGFGGKCCFIRFVVQQCIHFLRGIYLSGARRMRLIHMHSAICRTRCAKSSTEERKRHKRREKGTSSHPPNFSRACSRLRVRASDFRRYHIAILCLGPDDFVDVIHDDFPLCEKQ